MASTRLCYRWLQYRIPSVQLLSTLLGHADHHSACHAQPITQQKPCQHGLAPLSNFAGLQNASLPSHRAFASFCSNAAPWSTVVSFPLAQTGEGISECELMQWFVKEGDRVEQFQPICEVQSDKAAIEITSRYAGLIVKVHHSAGDVVKVGAPLVDIETAHSATTAAAVPAGEPLSAEALMQPGNPYGAPSSSSISSSSGGSTSSGVGPTEPKAFDDAGAPVLASPATASSSKENGGSIGSISGRGGDRMAAVEATDTTSAGTTVVLAAPAVRRLARELGVDIAKVQGTGPKCRVLREDVEGFRTGLVSSIADRLVDRIAEKTGPKSAAEIYAAAAAAEEPVYESAGIGQDVGVQATTQQADSSAAAATGATTAAQPAAAAAEAGAVGPQAVTKTPIRGYRRAMIKSSDEAAAIPTFHYMDEISVDNLIHCRSLLKSDPLLAGSKLTYLPFLIKALSIALYKYPGLNVSLEPGGEALLQRHSHNIGIAMATPSGLVVPNVKQVEQRSIPEIAQELGRLQQLAAAGRLSTEEVSQGSITVSNIGTVGGTYATPMLNPPEAAILALGRIQALPRYEDHSDMLVKRHIMSVSWGGDHRVVDGAVVAEFSNFWKQLLEQPARLLMHMK